MIATRCVLTAVLAAVLGCGAAAGAMFENPIELKVAAQIDPDSGEDSAVGGLLGLGYLFTDSLTAGVYGSIVTSDRELPVDVNRIYGMGVYGEQDLTVGYDLMPFVGASVGFLDPTGPDQSTPLHLAGWLGLRYALSGNMAISCAATLHWADEEIFDYKQKGPSDWEADDVDATADIAIRFYL